MDLRRTAIAIVVAIVVLVLGWNYQKFARAPVACESPIRYGIGVFNRRFGISQKYFLSALSEAEAIWEKPFGKELFTYSPKESEFSVNLIYDYRQEATRLLTDLGSALKDEEIAYNTLQSRFAGLKIELDRLKDIYSQRVEAFNQLNDAYEALVTTWNRGDRTSRGELSELDMTKAELEAEVLELNKLEAELNTRVREINELVEPLNRLADSLNLSVDEYNTVGVSRGETFTEGVYFSDATGRGIDIYEFGSHEKLVWVLAHELGHALGLDHNSDKKSIMYYLNENNRGVLSDTDLEALQLLCGEK